MKKLLYMAGLVLATLGVSTAYAGYNTTSINLANETVVDIDDVDGNYKAFVYDTANGNAKVMTVYNLAAQVDVETVITTNVLTSAECGKTLFLGLAGGFTTTLPAPVAGCTLNFVASVSPTTAYILVSSGGADIIHVHINELETDTSDDGVYDTNADTVNFVANIAVVGDYLKCISDGTGWYCNGQSNADGGFTASTT